MLVLREGPQVVVLNDAGSIWRRFRAALVVTAWIASTPAVPMAQVPIELRSAEALAQRSDSAGFDADLQAVDAELARVRSYLTRHPTDADVLILSVRLGWLHDTMAFRAVAASVVIRLAPDTPAVAGAATPSPPSADAYQAILDSVLARDSTVASAHYWKARLLGEEARLGDDNPYPDSAAVLPHLRRAVRDDPDNAVYRVNLAAVLSFAGRLDDAAAVLHHPATDGSAISLLVEDARAGAPPGGLPQPFNPMSLLLLAEDPGPIDYQWLRVLGWITEASLDEVRAHYRERWPDIRFFAQEEALEEKVATTYVAALLLTATGWQALSDSAVFARRTAGEMRDLLVLTLFPPDVMEGAPEREGAAGAEGRRRPKVGVVLTNTRPWPVRVPPARRPGR